MYELRPYQEEARDAVLREWNEGHRKTLLVAPTGGGKTLIFSSVLKEVVKEGGRALVLAHRGELIKQAADKIKSVCGTDVALEKAKSTSLGSVLPVTVGSVQSLSKPERLEKFPEDYFSCIVVDEAHHCLSESYKRVLDHFPSANVLGVTATPDRGDMKNLGEYFDSKAYEYSMAQAVCDGYLCPVKAQLIPLEVDISDVEVANGDFTAGSIGGALEPYLERIAREMAVRCKGRRTVVFLPLIATSRKFCAMLNRLGLRAVEINGKSEDREEKLSDFTDGKYDVICNSMLLTEGWDCPAVDCIVVLRPTKIRSLYQQMVGRGMRICPGKEGLLLLDFLWMTEKHELCRPSSLIAKNEEIAGRMNKRIKSSGDGIDLMEAEEQAERDILTERETTLAKELAEMRKKKRKTVNPIEYALSIEAEDLASYKPTFGWEENPPTRKQLGYLEKCGISPESVRNMGMASLLIDKLMKRQDAGLSTPRQIRCLERFGFRHVGTWTFESAGSMISALADNGWKVPDGITPSRFRPAS